VNTGTEIRIYRGRTIDWTEPKFPVRAGYCQVGIVEAVGPEAEGFSSGQRVFVMAPYQEVAAVPASLAIRIPDEISDEAAAFADLLDIGLCAIQRAEPSPGEYLAVIGQGVIGQSALACGRALGFRTIAIDLAEERLAISRKMGAELAISPADPEFLDQVKAFTHGDGVDLVVEAASVWPAIKTAYDIVRPRGRIVVPARHLDKPDFSPVGHPYQRYEIALMTSFSYYRFPGFENYPIDISRWTRRRNFELIWDLMRSGRLKIEPMVTNHVSYEELPEVFQQLDEGNTSMVGILVEW
jgi:threonine dehydrogenase-like Zn-dependent dehydrogenase